MNVERETLEREIGETAARLSALRRKRRQLEIAEGKNVRANSPRIQAIKKAYVANQISVAEVARAFATSPGFVQRLARDLDWPRRSPPKCHGQSLRRGVQTSQERAAD